MSNARRNQQEQRIAREVAAEWGLTYTEALRCLLGLVHLQQVLRFQARGSPVSGAHGALRF